MTLGIREATSDDRAGWTAFVASRPEGDILQSWAWGEAGAGEPGERWRRLVVVDAGDHVRGVAQVLDRRTTFGRTVLYVPHGPLWDRDADDAAEVLAHLVTGLKTHARARRGIVLKLDPRPADGRAGVGGAGSPAARGWRPARRPRPPGADDPDRRRSPTGMIPSRAGRRDARAEVRRAEREGRWRASTGTPTRPASMPSTSCSSRPRPGRLPGPLAGLPRRAGAAAGGQRRLVPRPRRA